MVNKKGYCGINLGINSNYSKERVGLIRKHWLNYCGIGGLNWIYDRTNLEKPFTIKVLFDNFFLKIISISLEKIMKSNRKYGILKKTFFNCFYLFLYSYFKK